jgi:hypothetical protein
MSFEVDHVFLLTDAGAPVADRLVDAGFTEGTSRTHPGQGTTNRRFFVENAMFELLWVSDETEASGEPAGRTRLLDRWRGRATNTSPVGVCLRPTVADEDRETADRTDSNEPAPFSTWTYRPPYLPADRPIYVAENADILVEPFLFVLPWAHPPADLPIHESGAETLTDLTVRTPAVADPSPSLRAVDGLLRLALGAHHLELGFDGGQQGVTLDFRPDAPLTIRY